MERFSRASGQQRREEQAEQCTRRSAIAWALLNLLVRA
jgi:hypothetical protein